MKISHAIIGLSSQILQTVAAWAEVTAVANRILDRCHNRSSRPQHPEEEEEDEENEERWGEEEEK